jgi:outer membrane protein assembly factor BamB
MNHKALFVLAVGSALLSETCAFAQIMPPTTNAAATNAPRRSGGQPAPETTPQAPETLPGNGLAQHDFLYAGENGNHLNIYVIRKGKLDWSYTHPLTRGEISDAMLLSNGNVLFARQFGVTEVSPDKKVVWNYDAPDGSEVHTAQAIGKDHVLLIENGLPPRLKVLNKTSGAVVKEFELPARGTNQNQVHGQFRHARITAAGNVLVAHLDLGKVAEYDPSGKEVWSYPVPGGAWTVQELPNGNILVTSESRFVREVNRKGETVWEFVKSDVPEIRISGMQFATRLANGNTIINSWRNKGNGTAVQAFEVSPDKKFVWGLRSWADPDLGPSTTIQVLDEPSAPENVHFGNIK